MATEPKPYDSVDLSDLLAKRGRTVVVNLGDGDAISVTWRPDQLEQSVYLQLGDAMKAAVAEGGGLDQEKGIRLLILPFLSGWSLTDGGKPLPLTEENVKRTGPIITRLIGDALLIDMNKVMSPEELADTKATSVA